jgi:carbon-monoxide dehydrogenase medium subunit
MISTAGCSSTPDSQIPENGTGRAALAVHGDGDKSDVHEGMELFDDAKFGFNEFSRRAGDFAMSAALVTYQLQGGKIADARVGVGGAEASPRRIAEAEAALNGQAPDDKAFRAAAEAAAKAIEPLEDHQTNAEYRRDLVRAVVRRALEQSSL